MKKRFKSARSAIQFVRSLLPNHYTFKLFGNRRHALFYTTQSKDLRFYCLFKRDFFRSFGEICLGEPSVGESVNVEVLEKALDLGVDYFLFVYVSGAVYKVSPLQVKTYAEKYGCKRLQEVESYRNPADGVKGFVKEREVTYSFPLSLMERWNGYLGGV